MSIYFNDICRLEFILNSLSEKSKDLKASIEKDSQIQTEYWEYYWNHRTNCYYANGVRFIYGYDGVDFYFYVQSKVTDTTSYEYDIPPESREKIYPEISFEERHKLTPERLEKLSEPMYEYREGLFRTKKIPIDCWDCDSREFYSSRVCFPAAWRDTFMENLEKAKVDLVKWYTEAQENLKKCKSKLKKIEEGIGQVKALLRKEYSLNIIPNKFRNLEAIWYICDYYDSSDETLKEILLHLDLDAIKAKLDTVIANQQKIIINQAIEIAQNNAIIAQNQEVLGRLASIEQSTSKIVQNTAQTAQNTASTAHWAQIAANNTEACAWISVANYIR